VRCAARPRLRRYARETGRDPTASRLEGRIAIAGSTPDRWRQEVKRWRGLGATHVSVVTMRAGLTTPQAHLDAVRRFLEAAKG